MIKEDLKKAGINNRQVSVRDKIGRVDIIIKDLLVDINLIKEIAFKYESIEYDKFNSEMMQGGNTFIFIEYDHNIKEKAINELKEISNKYINLLNNSNGNGINLDKNKITTIFSEKESNSYILYIKGKNNKRYNSMEALIFDVIYKYRLTLN